MDTAQPATGATADAKAPAASARTFWRRFSLRELFLATTAVCGLAAAFYTHRQFSPTNFLLTFKPQTVLDPLIRQANPTSFSFGSSGGGIPSHDGRAESRAYSMTIKAGNPDLGQLIKDLRTTIEAQLNDEGCDIVGRSYSDTSFACQYRCGPTVGIVSVIGFGAPDVIEIRYLAYEHR